MSLSRLLGFLTRGARRGDEAVSSSSVSAAEEAQRFLPCGTTPSACFLRHGTPFRKP
jgi:hypothetical protein